MLKSFGSSFTNNGLALSPDGRDIYFTLIPHTKRGAFNLLIERLSIATGQQTLIAHGEAPAISPDGRQLAYVTGSSSRAIAVRDLRSGRTRSVDVTTLPGIRADVFFNATISWIANPAELALITSTTSPVAVSDPSKASHMQPPVRARGPCGAHQVQFCLIIVRLPATSHGVTDRSYALPPAVTYVRATASDSATPGSILIARDGSPDTDFIDRITPGPSTVSIQQLALIPAGLALSFDATGDRLLYLIGHAGERRSVRRR